MADRLRWEYQQKGQKVVVDKTCAEKYPKISEFSFALVRNKDPQTHEESLEVKCLLNKKDNGKVLTSIDRLDKDIPQFRKYGVVLTSIQMADLKNVIEQHYLELDIVENNTFPFDLVIDSIKEGIKENDYQQKDGRYIIPVTVFNSFFDDEAFENVELAEIKRRLISEGYIDSKNGRTTKLVRIEEKPVRAVCLFAKKLG